MLEDERLVEMYLRQLWQVGRGEPYLKFPSAVLVKNGQTIRALLESLSETQTGRPGATNTHRPTATNDSTHDGESQ